MFTMKNNVINLVMTTFYYLLFEPEKKNVHSVCDESEHTPGRTLIYTTCILYLDIISLRCIVYLVTQYKRYISITNSGYLYTLYEGYFNYMY